jgi:hypothetical protein
VVWCCQHSRPSALHSTARHSTAQHGTARHSTPATMQGAA